MTHELRATSLHWGLIVLLCLLFPESTVEHWHEWSSCRGVSGQSWVRSSHLGDNSQPWAGASTESCCPEKNPSPLFISMSQSHSEWELSPHPAQPTTLSSFLSAIPPALRQTSALPRGSQLGCDFSYLQGQQGSELLAVTAGIAVPLPGASSLWLLSWQTPLPPGSGKSLIWIPKKQNWHLKCEILD